LTQHATAAIHSLFLKFSSAYLKKKKGKRNGNRLISELVMADLGSSKAGKATERYLILSQS